MGVASDKGGVKAGLEVGVELRLLHPVVERGRSATSNPVGVYLLVKGGAIMPTDATDLGIEHEPVWGGRVAMLDIPTATLDNDSSRPPDLSGYAGKKSGVSQLARPQTDPNGEARSTASFLFSGL